MYCILALFFLFVTNLPGVDDIVNQGTCDWICTADTDIDEESRNLLVNGSLAKFRILFEEQVYDECANQTDAKNSSDTASLWLKMADGGKPGKKHKARLQLVTETVLDGIFRGQFAFGAYKEVNVSCIFKLASIGKSSSSYSSRRLTFHTLQSVLYFVEHVANCSKPNATFLTLLRTEKNTRLSIGVTDTCGSLSSAKSANNNELILTDGWFTVALIISIVVLLYFPAIYIFFRPSEIKPRRTQEVQEDIRRQIRTTTVEAVKGRRWLPDDLRTYRIAVQETGDYDGFFKPYTIPEGHAPPTEHDALFAFQSDSSSAGSHKGGSEIEDPVATNDSHTKYGRLFSDVRTSTYNVPLRSETPPTESSTTNDQLPVSFDGEFDSAVTNQGVKEPISTRNISGLQLNSSQNRNNDSEQASTSQPNKNIEELSVTNILNHAEQASISLFSGNIEELSVTNILNDAEQASLSQSDRNIEEPSAANSLNEAKKASIQSQSERNTKEPSVTNILNDAEQPSISQSNRNIEEPCATNILNEAEQASISQFNRKSKKLSDANSVNGAKQASIQSQSYRNTLEEPSVTNIPNNTEQASISQSDGNIEEVSDANSLNDAEQASTSQSNSLNGAEQASISLSDGNTEEPSGAANSLNDAKQASISQSIRKIEELSDANSLNDAEQANISQSIRNIEEPSAAISLIESRVVIDLESSAEEEDEEETKCALAMIVGKTCPVGFGSFIGNKLFSTIHERNIAWNIVKLIFVFTAVPLLFFLFLGDLFLLLLPKLHSRLSDHFPFTFLTRSLGYGFLTSHPILLVPIVFSAVAYLIRLCYLCFLSSSTLEAKWRSCCFHLMHPTCFACKLGQYFISELPSSLQPCENCCNPAPSECSKYLDLPQNISHNLKKQPDIFIKCWECCSDFWKRNSICNPKGILFSLALVLISIIFFIIGICCTSPLVCLCHGRLRLFGSRVIESVVMIFSLVWVTIFSLLCAIPLGAAITGLIKLLGSHTIQVLPQVTILAVVLHYFWSCYKSFWEPYRDVAKFLASRYHLRFDQHEQNSGVNALIHYKQGDLKVIPNELFVDGCKEFGLSIKNDVTLLFVKLGFTLLMFLFVYPILSSDGVSDPATAGAITTFLAVAYRPINDAINGGKFHIFEAEADKVVNDYIARKQQRSS